MQILLRKDVEGLGHIGDVVEVKPGYGRNYLLPRQLAVAGHARQHPARREREEEGGGRAQGPGPGTGRHGRTPQAGLHHHSGQGERGRASVRLRHGRADRRPAAGGRVQGRREDDPVDRARQGTRRRGNPHSTEAGSARALARSGSSRSRAASHGEWHGKSAQAGPRSASRSLARDRRGGPAAERRRGNRRPRLDDPQQRHRGRRRPDPQRRRFRLGRPSENLRGHPRRPRAAARRGPRHAARRVEAPRRPRDGRRHAPTFPRSRKPSPRRATSSITPRSSARSPSAATCSSPRARFPTRSPAATRAAANSSTRRRRRSSRSPRPAPTSNVTPFKDVLKSAFEMIDRGREGVRQRTRAPDSGTWTNTPAACRTANSSSSRAGRAWERPPSR